MSKTEARVQAAAPVFSALGDPTRLALFSMLSDGASRSITELTRTSSVTRQAVTKHLAVLESAGLVDGAQSGREKRFALRRNGLDDARDLLDKISARVGPRASASQGFC